MEKSLQHNLRIEREKSKGDGKLSTRQALCSCGWSGSKVEDYKDLQFQTIKKDVELHLADVEPEVEQQIDKAKINEFHLKYSSDRDLRDINGFINKLKVSRKFGLPLMHTMTGDADGEQMRNCAKYLLLAAETITEDDVCEPLTKSGWFPSGQLYNDSRQLLGIVLNNNHQLS